VEKYLLKLIKDICKNPLANSVFNCKMFKYIPINFRTKTELLALNILLRSINQVRKINIGIRKKNLPV
jgi:hypothetical protein